MASFTTLPAELRIEIWQMSLPDPRNVTLSWNGEGFKANITPPNLAHVCHEARHELIKNYDLTFASPNDKTSAKIWFDFTRDTLYITDEALERMPAEIIQRVARLKHFRYTGAMALKCHLGIMSKH